MVLFRCTQRVLKRFRIEPLDQPPRSSGLLGDWYVNLLNAGPARFVLCLNERTLLPVILPARKSEFPAAFPATLQLILAALGIAPEPIEAEVEAVQEVVFGRTESRVVLGALNDFAFNARFYLATEPRLTTTETALRLAEMPSKPIGYSSPDRAVQALFVGLGPS